jgi:hypothetical protein
MTKRIIYLLVSYLFAVGIGFAGGIYALPILIAPVAPDSAAIAEASEESDFVGVFSRDRIDSDVLHWGEGEVSIGPDKIAFAGSLAPGPDYRLYLSPEFVETEADFKRLKSSMVQVGEVKTFENFVVHIPAGIDPSNYKAVIVWCETFEQYITSGTYL